jgi:DNA recombination protein RmuC
MQNILPVLCFIAGFALAWLVLRWRKQETESAFKALSADALARNNQAFLELARATLAQTQEAARGDLEMRQQAIVELVAPVRNSLDKVDSQIQELEKARAGAYAALHEQVRSLVETETQLRAETGKLVTALRTPGVRGRWGEIQLRRVVEMAGMLDHCDFVTQAAVDSEEGHLRPDLLVRLPAGKIIVVDAKTPLDGYSRIRGPVSARRVFLQRGARERPLTDRIRRGAEHHPGHSHHADRATARRGLRLAPGGLSEKRSRHRRAGQRPFQAPLRHG